MIETINAYLVRVESRRVFSRVGCLGVFLSLAWLFWHRWRWLLVLPTNNLERTVVEDVEMALKCNAVANVELALNIL